MTCEAHKYHWPKPSSFEEHHRIPRAWQRFWMPDWAREGTLWAPGTVTLCPTGHANVHAYIVAMMRAYGQARTSDPLDAAAEQMGRRPSQEARIAYSALTAFREAGGSLSDLYAAGQLGRGARFER